MDRSGNGVLRRKVRNSEEVVSRLWNHQLSLDGSENDFIHCAKELDGIQLPYTDESDDTFCEDLEDNDEESDEELSEDDILN